VSARKYNKNVGADLCVCLKNNMNKRKNIRLKNYDYSSAGLYFVTICTNKFLQLFGKIKNGEMILNEFGKIVNNNWIDLTNHYENILLHSFIVMPNHFHGIIEITNVGAIHELPLQYDRKLRRQMLIPKIIGRYKMQTSKQINILRKMQGKPVWQRNYYEHIIRNEQSYLEISDYIKNNPKKWETDKYFYA